MAGGMTEIRGMLAEVRAPRPRQRSCRRSVAGRQARSRFPLLRPGTDGRTHPGLHAHQRQAHHRPQHIYSPDVVVVLDPTLLDAVDVCEGLKENGVLLVNTSMTPADLRKKLG